MKLLVSNYLIRDKFVHEDYITDDYMLFLVEKGEFYINNGKDEALIGKNNAMIIMPGVKYHREVTKNLSFYIFRFTTNEDLSDLPLKICFEDFNRIESSMNLMRKLNSDSLFDNVSLKECILKDIINQYYIEKCYSEQTLRKKDALIDKAIIYFEKNLKSKNSLSEVSDELGISYVQFARRFRRYTGLSPNEYIIKSRMKLARELLGDEEVLIKEIAIVCGYENEYYFSYAFKKYNGISPSEYRKTLV